ncbi:SDR family oxidoreductase [Sphingomonas bacterium]|uniref:SDR family oxidoreductase n=1 Tax=Sphingomonas bacterium TaxID=1895847 RepID=UPI0015761303|nr:SDR family oxidoreductase [Sphingomonas bacterium]
MTRSTALVTGANKGIGLEIARQLGGRDFAVWLGCRDRDRGEAAAATLREEGIDANCLTLDVTDAHSIAAAAEQLGDRIGALDALVNNAGMSFGRRLPPSQEAVDEMRAIFDVNVFGVVRVTQSFLPLLRKSAAARIVMISSGLGSIASTLDMTSENWNIASVGYSASKTALNMVTAKFAKELAAEGMKVNAADPGLTATDLNGHMGSRTPRDSAAIAVRLATLDMFGPTGGFFLNENADTRPPRHPW